MTEIARCFLCDELLFFALQWLLVGFAVLCFLMDRFHASRAGHGGVQLKVTRGTQSMALFYGAYVAITGIFLSIVLQVEVAKDHRVFFALLDAALIFYLCLWNAWFRNKLIRWADRLASIETR